MEKNVLITGGTGFIGKFLTAELLKRNYSVSILTRNSKANTNGVAYYIWDVSNNKIEEEAVLKADYIIHLAGENIGEKKWTAHRKEEIRDSRTQSAQLIYSVLKKHNKRLEAFISASGIGVYGAVNGEGICTENTVPANDFVGMICQEWEKSADLMSGLGIRTVKIRTGLVLGKNEGIVRKLLPIFKRGFGSALGSGKQYMPWIHIQDLCNIYIEAIENKNMSGVFNATINDSTTNLSFSRTLASSVGLLMWLPNVPSFLMRMGRGEMSSVILTGR